MKYTYWLWPVLLVLSAAATWIVYTIFPDLVIRPFIVLWFFTICPGMALVRFLRLREHIAEYTLAVAVSLTLDALIASAQIYANLWSPTLTLNILLGICVFGAILQLLVLHSTARPMEQPLVTSS